MTPTSSFLDLPSVRIHLLRWPNPGASPILLLHATGFLAMIWRALAEPLSARHDVYAFDARGHGRSGRPHDAAYGIEPVAADTAEVLTRLDLGPVYAVGHSLGGAAATLVAAQRPHLIRRIYAIEPILPTNAWRDAGHRDIDAGDLAALARKRRPAFPSRRDVLDRWAARPPFSAWRSDILNDYVQHGFVEDGRGGARLRCDPVQAEAPTFDGTHDFDAAPYLSDVRCPVMLARGARTNPFFDSMLAAVAALLPDAQRETFPRLSHLAPMEDPDAVVARVRAFDAPG